MYYFSIVLKTSLKVGRKKEILPRYHDRNNKATETQNKINDIKQNACTINAGKSITLYCADRDTLVACNQSWTMSQLPFPEDSSMVTVETNFTYEEKDGGRVIFELPKLLLHLHKLPDARKGYLGPVVHTRRGKDKTPTGTLRAYGKHWIVFTFLKTLITSSVYLTLKNKN